MTLKNFLCWVGSLIAVSPAIGLAQDISSSPPEWTSWTRYDGQGRVVGTIAPDPDGPGPRGHLAVRTTYNAAGFVIRVENGELLESGGLQPWKLASTAPKDWGSDFAVTSNVVKLYDTSGRILVEKLNSGPGLTSTKQLTQFSYDPVGRLECTAVRMNPAAFSSLPSSACVLGAEGSEGPDRITKTIYDAAGQVIQIRKGLGTSVEQADVTRTYGPNGKILDVIDANGNRARMGYDGFGRLKEWCFPSKSRPKAFRDDDAASALASAGAVSATDCERYEYDLNGNRITLTKRDGLSLAFKYDALNRVVEKRPTVKPGVAAVHTRAVFYSYDAQGQQIAARIGTSTGFGVFSSYDGLGRLQSVLDTMDGRNLTLSYEYDANSNRTGIVYPDGTRVDAAYDGMNRASAIGIEGATNPDARYTYNNRGLVWRVQSYRNSTYLYDSAGRLSSLSLDLAGTGSDVTESFTRNPAGQIATANVDNTAYAWTGHVDRARAYAVNGLNQYTAAGESAFAYDANGNLISVTAPGRDGVLRTTSYAYDVENRLVQVVAQLEAGERTTTLYYDPSGRMYRISDSATVPGVGTGTQRFLYDGDALVLETNSANAVLRRYVHGADQGADDPVAWYEGGGADDASRRRLLRDARGSIVAVSDNLANLVAINSFDEYGIPAANNLGRFQYTGQTWVPEIGLYYYKARMYSPTLGRFMQTDPIGYEDQINLYSYVGNDPINGVDPTGESDERITEVLVGALSDVQLQSHIDSASSPGKRESRALDARADAQANGRASSEDYHRQALAANAQVNNEMSRLYRNGNVPSERQLEKFAKRQGWQRREEPNGVVIYSSRSGNPKKDRVDRLIVKPNPAQQSTGVSSQGPRMSFRNMFAGHVDPTTGRELNGRNRFGPQGHKPFRPRRPR